MQLRKIKITAILSVCTLLCSCGLTRWDGFEKEDLSKYLTLGEYKGLELTEYDTSVSDEEVEEAVNAALLDAAYDVETDEQLTDGDTVILDRFCFIGGESCPDLSEERGSYTLGAENLDAAIAALLPHMKGMRRGDTAELTVMLPEGYLSDNAPETEAIYRVTVISVLRKNIPVLNNEVAEQLMPGCGGVDGYRVAIKVQLEDEKATEAKYRRESEAWDKIVASSVLIDAPYDVFGEYYENILADYEEFASAQSQKLEEYVESSLMIEMAVFDEQAKTRALNETKEAFVLWSIVKAEGLSATDEEISVYAGECAADSEGIFGTGEDFISYYGTERVREMLLKDKIVALALSTAD